MNRLCILFIILFSTQLYAIDTDAILSARARTSYNLKNVAYSAISVDHVDSNDIVLLNGASYYKDTERNAIVFSVPANGFGLLYIESGLNKSKISCYYSLSVETTGTAFAIFNRAETNANTFVEGLIQPNITNVMLEKVYPPNIDVVLAMDNGTITMPFGITTFESYFDLKNNRCSVRKSNSPSGSKGIVSSAIGTYPATVFNNMMIGFQNTGTSTQTAVIYLPIFVMTN